MRSRRTYVIVGGRIFAIGAIAATGLVSGCGGSGPTSPAASAEAQSAASGDIPDNQVFLRFHDRPASFTMQYPEGWAQRGDGSDVTFHDKDNTIDVTVSTGPAPTVSSAAAALARMASADPSLQPGTPERITIGGAPVIKVTYTRQSVPNPVTGKRLTIMVDRYVYGKGGKVATLDLGTPEGVDNVDAYRMISESFQWQ